MEIASSFSSGGGGGGDDDDNNGNKKPLLEQQKENQTATKEQRKILTRTIMSENARLNTFLNELATRCGLDLGGVGITPNITQTIVRHFRQLYRSLEVSERQETDRVVDTIVQAYRRTRVDILYTNRHILEEQLEEERLISDCLTEINRWFTNGNPNNDLYWWDLDIKAEDEMSDAQIEAAAQDIQNTIREIANIRQIQMFQQLNVTPPPPPPQPPVAPATDNRDEEMDDEES